MSREPAIALDSHNFRVPSIDRQVVGRRFGGGRGHGVCRTLGIFGSIAISIRDAALLAPTQAAKIFETMHSFVHLD
jgi:hypothetical protein